MHECRHVFLNASLLLKMHIHLYSKQIALTNRVLFLSSENASNFRVSLHQSDATSENIDVKFTFTPDLKEHDAKEWNRLLVRKQPYYGILGMLKIGQGI